MKTTDYDPDKHCPECHASGRIIELSDFHEENVLDHDEVIGEVSVRVCPECEFEEQVDIDNSPDSDEAYDNRYDD